MGSSSRRRTTFWLGITCALAISVVYFSLSRTIVEIPGDGGGRYAHAIAYAAMMFMLGSCDNA